MSQFTHFLILFSIIVHILAYPLNPSTRQIGAWSPCSDVSGTCIDTSVYSCSSPTLTGKCPGPENVRCCPAPAGVRTGSCATESLGLCKRTSLCTTSVITGKCPGPADITCCPSTVLTPPPTEVQPPAITDIPSGVDCSFYKKIEERGNQICTDQCRSFEIENGWTQSFLDNAFCACDVTPKDQISARTVRECLQRRLISASQTGKTKWTRREIEEDHKVCYREASCPCGPAFSLAWDIVTTLPISSFSCAPVKVSILIFSRCNKCSYDPPLLSPIETCSPCPPGW